MKEVPLWQSSSWQRFQQALHHRAERVNGNLVLMYPLFFGFHYAYVPRGPVSINGASVQELLTAVEALRQKHHLVFLRMDPEKPLTLPTGSKALLSWSIQPETTLILDLTQDEEALRKHMKRKGRYNIDLAEKKGVRVKCASTPEERTAFCDLFYDLLMETGDRDRFFIHDRSYYQTMLETIPEADVFVAFHNEQALAAGIFIFLHDRAYYYYGASSREKKEFMAPYLLQWEAIRFAKHRGCSTYDFLGIAPADASSTHAWRGITEFKLKFGGSVVQYPKPVDIVYRPFLYQIYRFLKWGQQIWKIAF